MSLREELIQVAAVAVAMVEDLDSGESNFGAQSNGWQPRPTRGKSVLYEIASERKRQDDKWGPRHLEAIEWLAILAEEVGEAAGAIPWLKEDGSLHLNKTKDLLMKAAKRAHRVAALITTDSLETK